MEVKNKKSYSFLFGLYLGDGWVVKAKNKNSWELRYSLDLKYPGIILEVENEILNLFGIPARLQERPGCVNLKVTISKYIDWFPQHGVGYKHSRLIELSPFQKEIVEQYPEEFIRGLITSDGSIGYGYTNPSYKDKLYKTYTFSNRSFDIFLLFIWSLSLVGIIKQFPTFYDNRIYKITIRDKHSVSILEKIIFNKT